jgi:acetyltransferase-like isoleucine patch superfamily enzyme
VFTGPYVYITDQNHGYADPDAPIGRQLPVNDPVEIGAGSWLGAGAIVLPGARIGRNVVVAAGAVVTRGEIPDYSVVAGVPARPVGKRPLQAFARGAERVERVTEPADAVVEFADRVAQRGVDLERGETA